MLKFFKDSYEEGRDSVDTGLLAKIMNEAIIIGGNVKLSEEACHNIAITFLSGINYYFYLHPEYYVDFGKFVAYRNIDLKNLWVMEAKEGENAGSIYNYYKEGGLEIESLKRIIKNYVSNLLVDSTADEEAIAKDIEKIKGITSHSDTGDYNNSKRRN